MMISPESYAEQLKDASYLDLIAERDGLIRGIRHYEKNEKAGFRDPNEWGICPQPDVRYQMYLDYLAEVCSVMRKKYNHEYVWGNPTPKQDVEEKANGKNR